MDVRHLLLSGFVVLGLAACGATDPARIGKVAGTTPEDIVAHNAKARWDALIGKDFDAAYAYLTPGFRATTSSEAYTKRMLGAAIRWTDAKVRVVRCDDSEVCVATVDISYFIAAPMPGVGRVGATTPVIEKWLRSGNKWYHLPDAPSSM